ncbi:hypothetical protein DL89DRAFT_265211 [Linderina pennispora]|uniref:Uncharacterized protein n=1 Tax=Linderina pennispora TaxID=61395 RepID=A0A1Y1WHR1_9FUNG|nr:uncharacterized protein DL89DRAFT_265211 [Linderina pennispora]ORX73053.1 hypothetical protein DL89DRAFT_265211 [Linderina pennispora]
MSGGSSGNGHISGYEKSGGVADVVFAWAVARAKIKQCARYPGQKRGDSTHF